MEISFETNKQATLFNSHSALDRKFGTICAKKIRQRLNELEAVESLDDMMFGRPHELKGDRAGQVSVDLVNPLRLVFRPTRNPIPVREDGGLDRTKVKGITIIEVCDPH